MITTIQRWSGWSAAIGGLLMFSKGAVILLTGVQSRYIFEIAPLFLALGLWGLYLCLPEAKRTRLAQVGLGLAMATAVAAPIHLAAELFAPHLIPQEDTVTILTPFVVLSGMGALVSALLLGIVTWRTKAISPAWLPVAIPIGFVGLMIVAIVLEEVVGATATAASSVQAVTDRFIEIPVVIIGLAWLWLGFIINKN
jgi:hypothetical protein